MKSFEDPRHTARIIVLQQLFREDFKVAENIESEDFTLEEYKNLAEVEVYDTDLYSSIFNGVKDSREEIDAQITDYAPQWPVDQIKKVDLQILRIAIFEGFIGKITPPKVAIDEGIELAKEFGGNSSDKFVNGVLGAIYEKQKADSPKDNSSSKSKD
jgi:N utilization substance protein B